MALAEGTAAGCAGATDVSFCAAGRGAEGELAVDAADSFALAEANGALIAIATTDSADVSPAVGGTIFSGPCASAVLLLANATANKTLDTSSGGLADLVSTVFAETIVLDACATGFLPDAQPAVAVNATANAAAIPRDHVHQLPDDSFS